VVCGESFFCRFFAVMTRRCSAMRFLWAYLLAVIVFAFGFLCASAFSVGED